jgi:type IV pilus assembly protein PilB
MPEEKTTPPEFSSSLIGQRLVEAGYLTIDQLKEALNIQKDTGLLFGEVCVLQGWLSYQQVRECLPDLRSRVGDKLLAHGLITMQQLWLAILEQRQTGKRLGEILVERGWLSTQVLESVLGGPQKHSS